MALWFKAFPKAVQMFIPKAMKASSGTEVLFFAAVLSARPWVRGGSATADRTDCIVAWVEPGPQLSTYVNRFYPKTQLCKGRLRAWFPGYPSHR